jgi:cytochrome c-type biogenesis protein CcmE
VSKQHIKLSIGVVIIVAAVGYLMLSGSTGNAVYFLTVPEIEQKMPALQGAPLRVAGKVTTDPIQWDMRTLSLSFVMGEEHARLPVYYKGVKPDMFQPGADVIVEGRIGPNGVLVASTLMTSCPSKYQEEKAPSS